MPVSAHPTPLACKHKPGIGIFILHTPTPNATLLARNHKPRVGTFPFFSTTRHVCEHSHVCSIFFFLFHCTPGTRVCMFLGFLLSLIYFFFLCTPGTRVCVFRWFITSTTCLQL